jgi:hypothetical protein
MDYKYTDNSSKHAKRQVMSNPCTLIAMELNIIDMSESSYF